MARVYSKCFIAGGGIDFATAYSAPVDNVIVVRDMVVNTGGGGGGPQTIVVQDGNGIGIWVVKSTAGQDYLQWQGRQVIDGVAAAIEVFSTGGSGVGIRISGYLLTP